MSIAIQPISRPVITFEDDPGLTEQSHLEKVKINYILKQYQDTGVVNHVAQYAGQYGDFLGIPDFKEAQDKIAEAKSMFETVPATIRQDFDNDPAQFVEFMSNPDNIEAIEEYGLDASHLVLSNDNSDPPHGPKKGKKSRQRDSEPSQDTGGGKAESDAGGDES